MIIIRIAQIKIEIEIKKKKIKEHAYTMKLAKMPRHPLRRNQAARPGGKRKR